MVVVTGGGTGGHLYPGLAIAQGLRERGHQVSYVGAKGGLEERILPQSGLDYRLITAGKLSREALRPAEGLKVLRSLVQARQLMRQWRPQAVVSTGGYAGFPMAFIAQQQGIATVIHESNARLGLAARWLAPRASRLALGLEVALPAHLRSKARRVGLPIREERLESSRARQALGLESPLPLLLVLGGSQGSLELNQQLPQRLQPFLGQLQVLHQTGTRWEASLKPLEQPGYRIAGFVDTIAAFSAAQWVVCRAGASTLAELAYHQLPALLVPLPANLDNGTQLANAQLLASHQAALCLSNWDTFENQFAQLLDSATRPSLVQNLAAFSPQGATERMVALVEELL